MIYLHTSPFLFPTVLIEQLYNDKCISAEEASRLTSTKLFTTPPPTTTTIPSVAYSNVMTNGCNMKTSTTNDSSVTITHTTTTATTDDHNVSTVTNGMFTETSRSSTSIMGTTGIHNSDAIASGQVNQHGELQHTSSTGASLQPGIVEAPDADESFNNKVIVTSTDGNNMQHTMQPLQSTHTADMTVNGTTENVTKSSTEDNSQCISSTNPERDSEHPDTPPIVQNQQNNTMEGRNIICICIICMCIGITVCVAPSCVW